MPHGPSQVSEVTVDPAPREAAPRFAAFSNRAGASWEAVEAWPLVVEV